MPPHGLSVTGKSLLIWAASLLKCPPLLGPTGPPLPLRIPTAPAHPPLLRSGGGWGWGEACARRFSAKAWEDGVSPPVLGVACCPALRPHPQRQPHQPRPQVSQAPPTVCRPQPEASSTDCEQFLQDLSPRAAYHLGSAWSQGSSGQAKAHGCLPATP